LRSRSLKVKTGNEETAVQHALYEESVRPTYNVMDYCLFYFY